MVNKVVIGLFIRQGKGGRVMLFGLISISVIQFFKIKQIVQISGFLQQQKTRIAFILKYVTGHAFNIFPTRQPNCCEVSRSVGLLSIKKQGADRQSYRDDADQSVGWRIGRGGPDRTGPGGDREYRNRIECLGRLWLFGFNAVHAENYFCSFQKCCRP